MKKAFLAALMILISSVFTVFAQETEDEDWFWDQPISKIEFEGLKTVKKSDLVGITADIIGSDFTLDVYQELLDRLDSMDIFNEIEPYAKHADKKTDNVMLVIKVVESPVITKINFEGAKKIRSPELKDIIKNKTSDIFVEGKILMDERLIRDHYLEKGYTDSKVSHKIKETEAGVEVTFVINEGYNTIIREIHTTGNTIVSERVLKRKLGLKESNFIKEGAFQTSTLEQDKRVIVSYYQERGYVDAEIVDVKIETETNDEKTRKEMILTFVISEGSQYKYSGLTISGNEIFTEAQLLDNMKLKPGATFNSVKFEEGLAAITGLYYENGYMTNEFYPIPIKDSDKKEIGYSLQIRENTRSRIENIIIKGNSKTKDYVIRREIPLESGDVFSRDKVYTAMRNLYNLQFFSAVVPDVQSGSEPNLVDLAFSVEEQSTTTLNFGMTFSGVTDPNEWPVSLYVKLSNSNLFGEGKSFSGQFTISNIEQSFDLSYAQNWIGNLPITYQQSLAFSHSTSYAQNNTFLPDLSLNQYYYYMRYQSWSASLGTAFGRRWTPDFAIISASAGLNNTLTNYLYDENLYVPSDLGISMFANRWGILNTVWAQFSVDDRDINYDPSSGWFVSQRIGWNGLIPNLEKEFFLRTDTKLEGYLTLFDVPLTENYNFKGVLSAYSGLSCLFPAFNSTISESNRIYVDGIINGRGWAELNKQSTTKGQVMWSNKLELRLPIVSGVVGATVFHDAVIVKDSVDSLFTDFNLNDVYFSFGPGLRILMQQIPLHFLFAFKYQIIDGKFQWDDVPFEFTLSYNLLNR